MNHVTYPKWTMEIREGDVLRSPSGMLRIARKVSQGATPQKTWVHFTIQRCSWTGRCCTVYNSAELYRMGWEPTDGRLPLKRKFDRLIRKDIDHCIEESRELTCCDVAGVA